MAPTNQTRGGRHYAQPGQPASASRPSQERSHLVEPSTSAFTQYTAYRSDYPPLYTLDEDPPPSLDLTGEFPVHLDDAPSPEPGPEGWESWEGPAPLEEEYQSAYVPDGSYIVRDSTHPAQSASPRTRARDRRAESRALLEKRLSLVVLGLLACSFGLGVLLLLLLPRSTESKIEKRLLAEFPKFSLESYFSGDYTAGIATFFDDTVPNRDGLKNLRSNIMSLFGLPKSENSVEFVGKVNQVDKNDKETSSAPPPSATPLADPGSQPASQPDSAGQPAAVSLDGAAGRHMDAAATPTPPPPAPPKAEEANMTENGLIVLKLDGHYRALELFGGGSGDSYIQALNSLQGQVGQGVKIWSMPAPLACEFYTPSEYSSYTSSHSQCFDAIAARLDPGIQSINLCPVLAQHTSEPIYCRTDHHWQALGAYYAAQAFAGAAGVPFDDLSTYQEVKKEGFVGSMYSFTQSANLLNDPEDFVYYLPAKTPQAVYYDTAFSECQWDGDDLFQERASGSDSYMTFLGGDEYIVKASAQAPNQRKLLIIKDSYGNAIVPFLTGSFQEVIVADMRYMERNLVSFIRDMGVTDVLFTMSSYSLVGEKADHLDTLLTQNAGETITDPHPGTAPES